MKFGITALVATFLVGVGASVGHVVDRATQGHPRARHAVYAVENEATQILRKGFAATGRCGVERWDEKTLSTSDVSSSSILQYAATPRRTTVPALVSLPVPGGAAPSGPRVPASAETTVWRLSGTYLVAYKLELDSDIHLKLESAIDGSTMVAEIPDPGCVSNAAARPAIAAARDAFVRDVGTPTGYYQNVRVRVALSGPGFFDFVHGQNGVAPSGIEIHPVLRFAVRH